jgi:mono/diheme cytochrome c family protein
VNSFLGTILRSPLWLVLFLGVTAIELYPSFRNLVLEAEDSAAQRGHEIALGSGCFSCHGPGGRGGVKNPGSKDGTVPAFVEGEPMMWVNSEQEVREYILDGAPQRKRDNPRYANQVKEQLLQMPAYRGYLSEAEVDDLVAYIRAVSGLASPTDELALQGQDLAYRFGCFDCHGPMGAGGVGNLGSLKGYIPGWWGKDFADLVRSDGELREWLLEGRLRRLDGNPIARRFTEGQRIQMPAYKDVLNEEQLRALMAYVRWVNQGTWQEAGMNLGH